ncbi:hypothetical protein [Streptomyces noursei]|uniref:hypothetical protein n=1 Tax=Streptomyces noursei TaxID=1971 RepID=UPI00381FB0A5
MLVVSAGEGDAVGVSGGGAKVRAVDEWRDVYDLLDALRQRPSAWVSNSSLQEPAVMMFGYHLALQVHDADEEFAFHRGIWEGCSPRIEEPELWVAGASPA